MSPEQITLQQAIAEERARLWMQVWDNIAVLDQLVNESQRLVDDARFELCRRMIDKTAAPLPAAEQDASA
jgi:hypothetical protein